MDQPILHVRFALGEHQLRWSWEIDPWLRQCAQAIVSYGGGFLPPPLDVLEVEAHPLTGDGTFVFELCVGDRLAGLVGVCLPASQGEDLWSSLCQAARAVKPTVSAPLGHCPRLQNNWVGGWLGVVHTPLLLCPSSAHLLPALALAEAAVAEAVIRPRAAAKDRGGA